VLQERCKPIAEFYKFRNVIEEFPKLLFNLSQLAFV